MDAYLITNIEESGKFMSYCIRHNINVWRVYWDEREKGDICYSIDWGNGRCYYDSRKWYESNGYEIFIPCFVVDEYGGYKVTNRPYFKEREYD